MSDIFETATLVTGILVFLARVFDVTMGTLRTISIVQGRTTAAFFMGLFEITMWLAVMTTVIGQVAAKPILGVFYALGFSTGNVVGILVERRLALGHLAVRVISANNGPRIAGRLREFGLGVTTFPGEGKFGPVTLLYIVCERKSLRGVINAIHEIEPEAFYTTEVVGSVARVTRPAVPLSTGWRAVAKKK